MERRVFRVSGFLAIVVLLVLAAVAVALGVAALEGPDFSVGLGVLGICVGVLVIAQAMLARQQASAIVGARFKIVEGAVGGAVGMVSSALEKLREQNVVDLDEKRKAQMVSNLLVVLCGDRAAQPVVNTGSLYS